MGENDGDGGVVIAFVVGGCGACTVVVARYNPESKQVKQHGKRVPGDAVLRGWVRHHHHGGARQSARRPACHPQASLL